MLNRRSFLQSGLAIGAAALTTPNLAFAQASGYGIRGGYAPELKVGYWIDAAGNETDAFKLAEHSNKWVLLKCFQSWCPGCHSHGLPALEKISKTLADNPHVAFAGIQTVFEGHYINTVEKVRETQLQYGLEIPMGHDPGIDHQRPHTMADYRTGGTPWMILIAPDRQVVYNDFGIDADKAIHFLQEQTASMT
ncbi:MAG: redoxin domain-containing protein [Pseudomonadota bacterium]